MLNVNFKRRANVLFSFSLPGLFVVLSMLSSLPLHIIKPFIDTTAVNKEIVQGIVIPLTFEPVTYEHKVQPLTLSVNDKVIDEKQFDGYRIFLYSQDRGLYAGLESKGNYYMLEEIAAPHHDDYGIGSDHPDAIVDQMKENGYKIEPIDQIFGQSGFVISFPYGTDYVKNNFYAFEKISAAPYFVTDYFVIDTMSYGYWNDIDGDGEIELIKQTWMGLNGDEISASMNNTADEPPISYWQIYKMNSGVLSKCSLESLETGKTQRVFYEDELKAFTVVRYDEGGTDAAYDCILKNNTLAEIGKSKPIDNYRMQIPSSWRWQMAGAGYAEAIDWTGQAALTVETIGFTNEFDYKTHILPNHSQMIKQSIIEKPIKMVETTYIQTKPAAANDPTETHFVSYTFMPDEYAGQNIGIQLTFNREVVLEPQIKQIVESFEKDIMAEFDIDGDGESEQLTIETFPDYAHHTGSSEYTYLHNLVAYKNGAKLMETPVFIDIDDRPANSYSGLPLFTIASIADFKGNGTPQILVSFNPMMNGWPRIYHEMYDTAGGHFSTIPMDAFETGKGFHTEVRPVNTFVVQDTVNHNFITVNLSDGAISELDWLGNEEFGGVYRYDSLEPEDFDGDGKMELSAKYVVFSYYPSNLAMIDAVYEYQDGQWIVKNSVITPNVYIPSRE